MGRKLGESIILALTLIFFGLLFASTNATHAQSDNLRIYIHMQPEKPNSADFRFWEGSGVRIKLEMFDKNDNPQSVASSGNTTPPTKVIDYNASGFKILYVWDNLDTTKVIQYQNPFQPIEGEHWLFAYATNSNGIYATPATRFFVQYRLNKLYLTPTTSQVYVSPDYVRWGNQGQPAVTNQAGQITEEATSTAKIISPTPIPSQNPSIFQTLGDKIKNIFSGGNNIWILLLSAGIILLIVAKLIFGNGKEK